MVNRLIGLSLQLSPHVAALFSLFHIERNAIELIWRIIDFAFHAEIESWANGLKIEIFGYSDQRRESFFNIDFLYTN